MQIIKVPGINGLGKTKGCERSGNAILESLNEIYSNESGIPIDVRLLDLEEIHLDNSNLEITNKLIYENACEIFSEQNKVIFLGGDHSISFSLVRGFMENCHREKKNPCLIVFDAHPDCMPVTKMPEDEKFFAENIPTHPPIDASRQNSAKNFFIPTHEEWLRGIIEEGFPSKNILLVGVRNSDVEEIRFLREKGIRTIGMNQLMQNLEDSCDIIMEFSNGKELYLSLDIDVVDPTFAPATGYQEVGGLSSRQFIYLIQRLNKVRWLKAVDIVEINSEKDKEFGMITTKLGAKILGEFL
ncbi:arginase family protein [Candidatus Pacearchaeota archaeon]|nr:arginase family protein [Candidatus Pacearchaeota archaeon]